MGAEHGRVALGPARSGFPGQLRRDPDRLPAALDDLVDQCRGVLRLREIPIAFRDRVRGKSKMSFSVALRFFFRWLLAMFQYVVRGVRPRGDGAKVARTAEALHPEAPGK